MNLRKDHYRCDLSAKERVSVPSLWLCVGHLSLASHGRLLPGRWRLTLKETALSGGSLGSCVDEERSQLRELV